MATGKQHKQKSSELGAFWRQGNPTIRRIMAKAKTDHVNLFEHPDVLINGCLNYFHWVDNTPWEEGIITFHKGDYHSTKQPKVRAYTLEGLCAYLGISLARWRTAQAYDKDDDQTKMDVACVMDWAQNVIYEQTFSAAAAGLLRENIVMRKLGLAEKQERAGKDGGPIEVEAGISQAAREFREMMMKMAERGDE